MAAKYELNDASVVVVIGSGAGGGTLANELCQKGVKVVCLEAGNHLTLQDVVNDEFAMWGKLTWQDPRTGQPIWIVKAVGGSTVHWGGCRFASKTTSSSPAPPTARSPEPICWTGRSA
jgi:choline dehydrogenase-like flavoprotein